MEKLSQVIEDMALDVCSQVATDMKAAGKTTDEIAESFDDMFEEAQRQMKDMAMRIIMAEDDINVKQ